MNKMRILHNARVMQSCADGKLFIDQGDGTLHEVGGGGASSWNDLKDKPFGETVVNIQITWDGETDGLIEGLSTTVGRTYKVSDLTPTTDELLGGTTIFGQETGVIDTEYIEYVKSTAINGNYLDFEIFVVVYKPCTITDSNGDTFEISETGIYFAKSQYNADLWMESLTNVGEVVKTLDPKYLPGCPVWYFDENSTYGSIYADVDKTIEIPYSVVRDTILSVSPWLKNLDPEYPAFVKPISVDIRDSSVYITYYDGDYKYFTAYDPNAMDG